MTMTASQYTSPRRGGLTRLPAIVRACRRASHGDWPVVRITEIEVVGEADTAPSAPRRVRATVGLGSLVPADVRVHLATERADLADRPPRTTWRTRLASAQSYVNGTYVFEGYAAPDALEGSHRLVVLIELVESRDRAPSPPRRDGEGADGTRADET